MAASSDETNELCVTIKWSGKEYSIEHLSPSETVKHLKELIKDKTGVLPERQKLLGLKYKGTCKAVIFMQGTGGGVRTSTFN